MKCGGYDGKKANVVVGQKPDNLMDPLKAICFDLPYIGRVSWHIGRKKSYSAFKFIVDNVCMENNLPFIEQDSTNSFARDYTNFDLLLETVGKKELTDYDLKLCSKYGKFKERVKGSTLGKLRTAYKRVERARKENQEEITPNI